MNPIPLFQRWFSEELKQNSLKHTAASCPSTTGLDGCLNARLVSLKEIVNESFVKHFSKQQEKQMKYNLTYYITLLVIKPKGFKDDFCKDTIGYKRFE